jgi:hypothetical protein
LKGKSEKKWRMNYLDEKRLKWMMMMMAKTFAKSQNLFFKMVKI